MTDDVCWSESQLAVGYVVWCICLSVSPHRCLFQTRSGFYRTFLSLLLLYFFDETALFVHSAHLSGLFGSAGQCVAMVVHVGWVVSGMCVAGTCRLLVFHFQVVRMA